MIEKGKRLTRDEFIKELEIARRHSLERLTSLAAPLSEPHTDTGKKMLKYRQILQECDEDLVKVMQRLCLNSSEEMAEHSLHWRKINKLALIYNAGATRFMNKGELFTFKASINPLIAYFNSEEARKYDKKHNISRLTDGYDYIVKDLERLGDKVNSPLPCETGDPVEDSLIRLEQALKNQRVRRIVTMTCVELKTVLDEIEDRMIYSKSAS
jgi:hypothetical protein